MSRERREGFDEIGKKLKTEIDECSVMGKRQALGISPAAGNTLNTITPCAACKLLRRRCAEECPFSPYFSPQEPQKFAAVHKVFGASNVSKMLMEVPEPRRADAANCLVYEANVRLRDPVYGCMGAISTLQQQVQVLQAQLNVVRAEIIKYKYREAANTIINASAHDTAAVAAALSVSVAELPQAPPTPTLSPPAPTFPLPPPSPRQPPPSIVVPAASTVQSLYTSPASNTAGYGGIPNNINHLPYFD